MGVLEYACGGECLPPLWALAAQSLRVLTFETYGEQTRSNKENDSIPIVKAAPPN
jgi:hypothetical protein